MPKPSRVKPPKRRPPDISPERPVIRSKPSNQRNVAAPGNALRMLGGRGKSSRH